MSVKWMFHTFIAHIAFTASFFLSKVLYLCKNASGNREDCTFNDFDSWSVSTLEFQIATLKKLRKRRIKTSWRKMQIISISFN